MPNEDDSLNARGKESTRHRFTPTETQTAVKAVPYDHHDHAYNELDSGFKQPRDLLTAKNVARNALAEHNRNDAKNRGSPKSLAPIDVDERSGLRAIREFLRERTCYEVLPLSFRLIELDVNLTVKESLAILISMQIVSAPMWDSATSTYQGLLTVNDYLNVVQYYNQGGDHIKPIEQLLLSDLRTIEHELKVKSPETISTRPEAVLYDALMKQLESRAKRIPLISDDSESQRTMVVSVITQYRILKFIAINVNETDKLRKPLSALKGCGTFTHLFRCSMEATVLEVIYEMVRRNISSVPVCTTDDVLLNVFEAVDVIEILKSGDYSDLNWSIGKALAQRPANHPGVYTCTMDDGLDTIFDTIRKSRVHRLTVIDENNVLKGVLSLSDILGYILVGGEEAED